MIFKTGARHHAGGSAPRRLPDEALSLVQILDLGVTTIGASSVSVPVG